MRMVSKYEEFCKLHDQGMVKPDTFTPLGRQSVESLRRRGWKIGKWWTARDLLAICRQHPDNFELAFRDAGIDFWVKGE